MTLCIEALLDHIRCQEGNDARSFDRLVRRLDGQTVCLGFCPAAAVRPQPNDDIEAAVLEVQRVSTALAAITQNRDLLVAKAGGVDISFQIHLHGYVSPALGRI